MLGRQLVSRKSSRRFAQCITHFGFFEFVGECQADEGGWLYVNTYYQTSLLLDDFSVIFFSTLIGRVHTYEAVRGEEYASRRWYNLKNDK